MMNTKPLKRRNLPKEYFFPSVEGSNFSFAILGDKILNGFITVFRHRPFGKWTKVTSYNQKYNYFHLLPLYMKVGYRVDVEEKRTVDLANRYLAKQYGRMRKLLINGDHAGYTRLFELLAERSVLFQTVFLIKKLPKYGTDYTFDKCHYLIMKIRRIMKGGKGMLKYKRLFLAERDKEGYIVKHRPLGVPDIEWRVIGGMYDFYLSNLWHYQWPVQQFACMPGRGVADAWMYLIARVIQKENILGIDLAKFFDSVRIKVAAEVTPDAKGLRNTLWAKPKIRHSQRMLERLRVWNTREETYNVGDHYAGLPFTEGYIKWAKAKRNEFRTGLPQGYNVSPIISCQVLNTTGVFEDLPFHIAQYMDDAVLASDDRSVDEMREAYSTGLRNQETGISISISKTETIKEDGFWRKPLKFLGCEYDPFKDTFRANTRKNGVYEVKDASDRIAHIIEWLADNRGEIQMYAKVQLNKLISKGWARADELGITNQGKTYWDRYHSTVETYANNCVEAYSMMKYASYWGNNPVIWSVNTMSMVNAGALIENLRMARSKQVKQDKLEKASLRLATANFLLRDH